jgi:hypothetical protein
MRTQRDATSWVVIYAFVWGLGACQEKAPANATEPCSPLTTTSLFSPAHAQGWAAAVTRSLAQQRHNTINPLAVKQANAYLGRHFFTGDSARLYTNRASFFQDVRAAGLVWNEAHPCALYLLEEEDFREGDQATYVLLAQPTRVEFYTFIPRDGRWEQQFNTSRRVAKGALTGQLDTLLANANSCSEGAFKAGNLHYTLSRFTSGQGWVSLAGANSCGAGQRTLKAFVRVARGL